MRPQLAALGLVTALGLAACAGSPAPPMRYYQLRVEPPSGEAAAAPPAATVGEAEVWQLMSPVRLPEYLDRDALWLAVGSNALQPLEGHRWAEPLHTTVPRTLAHDLGVLRGADRVWAGSPPGGLAVARQLRVEILEFAPVDGGRSVRLRARWTFTDPNATGQVQLGEAEIDVPSASAAPAQLVDAHRLALWRLAQRLAQKPAAR